MFINIHEGIRHYRYLKLSTISEYKSIKSYAYLIVKTGWNIRYIGNVQNMLMLQKVLTL